MNDMLLVLLAGQSNMAGRSTAEPDDLKDIPGLYRFTGDFRWFPAIEPIHRDRPFVGAFDQSGNRVPSPDPWDNIPVGKGTEILDHFFIFQKNSLHLKLANFSSLKRRSIFTSRKILREKLELHSASKKSLNIAKMVEKRFELPTSTHDLSYEKIRLADCHKIPIFF